MAIGEHLTKASHDAEFIAGELQAAFTESAAVEGLALVDLIRLANELKRGVDALRTARYIDSDTEED